MYAEVAHPFDRIFLKRDLTKLNYGVLRGERNWILVKHSRPRSLYPPHPLLTLYGLDLEVSSSFKLLGVTIDDKLTFEKHIRKIASSIAQKTGLIR